jgi:hypothetical protein
LGLVAMKPRFDIVHTAEDFEIWLQVVRASAMPAQLWAISEIMDGRDADLMLKCMESGRIEIQTFWEAGPAPGDYRREHVNWGWWR